MLLELLLQIPDGSNNLKLQTAAVKEEQPEVVLCLDFFLHTPICISELVVLEFVVAFFDDDVVDCLHQFLV